MVARTLMSSARDGEVNGSVVISQARPEVIVQCSCKNPNEFGKRWGGEWKCGYTVSAARSDGAV